MTKDFHQIKLVNLHHCEAYMVYKEIPKLQIDESILYANASFLAF